MSPEKFSPWLDALGTERMEIIEAISFSIEPLQRLVNGAKLLLTVPMPITEPQFVARYLYGQDHPEEAWACFQVSAKGSDAKLRYCLDHTMEDSPSAVAFPPIHMQLLTWWLTHTWRYLELTNGCIASLHSWDLHIATVLARALLEEVGCCLYEAQQISKLWEEAKIHPPENRAGWVYLKFLPILSKFHFGSRGLSSDDDDVKAVNVMTYIDKLDKQCKGKGIKTYYNWLSNAAHPAIYARHVYSIQVEGQPRDGIHREHVDRWPTPLPEQDPNQFQFIGRMTADALAAVAIDGFALLWQALQVVDDFGLTTQAYRLTKRRYWRKFGLDATEKRCPCSCGAIDRSKHEWGTVAPQIVMPPTVEILDQIAEGLD